MPKLEDKEPMGDKNYCKINEDIVDVIKEQMPYTQEDLDREDE